MTDLGIGAGLGALAFWGFLATCVAVGVWAGIRMRETQHETLRRLMENGKPIDQRLMTKLMGGEKDRDLKAAGIIMLFVAPGLALLGWFLSRLSEWALASLLGVAVLVACIGVGLLVASKAIGGGDTSVPKGPIS